MTYYYNVYLLLSAYCVQKHGTMLTICWVFTVYKDMVLPITFNTYIKLWTLGIIQAYLDRSWDWG